MTGEQLTAEQRETAQKDLLRFTALNAFSFEILAGQILILFARQVGASLAQIGLLSALLPFASIIQLAVAPLVNRFGPRVVMLVGWGARTAVSVVLFMVPVVGSTGGAAAATQVLLWVMGGFYLCRALGMSSWLPLLQEIVRPQDRGLYLSRQEWIRQVSIVLVAVITAAYLLGETGTGRYLHVIGIGVLAAAWSLYFLWRVPDVGEMAESLDRDYLKRATAPARDAVFRLYLTFSITLRMVLSAVAPFIIVFLREGIGLPASGVIAVTTVGSVGAILTLGWWGQWSDRHGAKPALALSITGMSLGLLLWLLAKPSPAWHWFGIPTVSLISGIFAGGLTVSMSKFELGFIPAAGRAHYVALNVTAVGITSAVATFLAGRLLQLLSGIHREWGWLTLDQYRIFFVISALSLLIPLVIRRSLPEERSRSLRALMRREWRRRAVLLRRMARRGPRRKLHPRP